MNKIHIAALFLFVGPVLCLCRNVAALEPSQIAVIVNSDNPESQKLAQYYCRKRSVPMGNIIAVGMPNKETVSRQEYEQNIAPKIRQRLSQPDMADKIKCLLTVRGVPLKIGKLSLTGDTAEHRDLIRRLTDEYFGQLQEITDELKKISQPASPDVAGKDPSTQNFRMPHKNIDRQRQALKMFQQATQALQNAQQTLQTGPQGTFYHKNRVKRFGELMEKLYGLAGTVQHLSRVVEQTFDPDEKQRLQQQLEQYNQRLGAIQSQAPQFKQISLDTAGHERRYQLIYEALGLNRLCQVLLSDRLNLDDEESGSSFDSELSLILWDSYNRRLWQSNHLFVYNHVAHKSSDEQKSNPPTLMVSRLDGPTAEIALGLIDKAMAAEKTTLHGKAYFDARDNHKDIKVPNSEGFYDESIRLVSENVAQKTNLEVILDDQDQLFGIGACPDTILYCGWYSLQQYIPSFKFKLGAVGYHIASFEAETMINDPNNNRWCKRMLEEGITATIGAVDEPYLHSFPRPQEFFADLISGKYCLAECFYRTKAFNSWQLTLFGDPLYRPRFADKSAQPQPIETSPTLQPKEAPKPPPVEPPKTTEKPTPEKKRPPSAPHQPQPRRRKPPPGRGFRPAL